MMTPESHPLPKNIEVIPGMDHIIIRRRWLGPHAFFLLIFALIWDGFLVAWYAQALRGDNPPMRVVDLPLLHLGAGLFITYLAIAMLINKTDVKISSSIFSTRSHPLKWLGDRTIPVSDLVQFYTARKVARTKNGTSVHYELRVVTKRNEEFTVFGGQAPEAECLAIEKEIEKIIGIKNEKVEGELGG